jgi:hypothetical protein
MLEKEQMDRSEIWVTNSIHTTADCLIYYVRYKFRLYGVIKEIVMKYLQLAPKAQDVYKCKFEVHSIPPSGGTVGWNPDIVIGIFHLHNPFSCSVVLGSTQLLTEKSTIDICSGLKAAGP